MKKTQGTDLTIILVNFNTPDWTTKSLQSIQKFALKEKSFSSSVMVVDNGSSDDSVKQIRKAFPDIHLSISPINLGFAAGNNLGIRQAKSRYVMLLNSDAELTAQTHLAQLIEYLDAHPTAAVLSPKVSLPDGSLDPASHRGDPTPWAAASYFLGLEKLFPKSHLFGQYHQGWVDMSKPHPVDACSGAAMIVRSSAIEEIGLLDEAFFMYAEDLDWCRRFRDAGWLIIFHPGGEVIHHKYKSGMARDGAVATKVRTYFYQTMLQYFDKHFRLQYPGWVRSILVLFVDYKKGSA